MFTVDWYDNFVKLQLQLMDSSGGMAIIYGHDHQSLCELEESLIDNLLNFAGTPKVWLHKLDCSTMSCHI